MYYYMIYKMSDYLTTCVPEVLVAQQPHVGEQNDDVMINGYDGKTTRIRCMIKVRQK